MQTRRSRQDASQTEKPRQGAKKKKRTVPPPAVDKDNPQQGRKMRSSSLHQQQPRAQAAKKGRPLTADKERTNDGKKAAPQSAPSTSQAANNHESEHKGAEDKIKINRAPVLTMWVAVVAAREGYSYTEGLSFGKAVAGLLAQSKGRRLGLYEEPSKEKKEERKRKRKDLDRFPVFGMNIPGNTTQEGLRLAMQSGKPILPPSVEDYLHRSFGDNYERARGAMEDLANSYSIDEVGKAAYPLYEKFRPTVPYGSKGWGAKGVLDIESMRAMRKV